MDVPSDSATSRDLPFLCRVEDAFVNVFLHADGIVANGFPSKRGDLAGPHSFENRQPCDQLLAKIESIQIIDNLLFRQRAHRSSRLTNLRNPQLRRRIVGYDPIRHREFEDRIQKPPQMFHDAGPEIQCCPIEKIL
jgi:hypothetical protein